MSGCKGIETQTTELDSMNKELTFINKKQQETQATNN